MNKDSIIENLNNLFNDVAVLESSIDELTGDNVYRTEIRDLATLIARKWFEEFSIVNDYYQISAEVQEKYDTSFERILELSLKASRKNSYKSEIGIITENWKIELLIPLIKHSTPIESVSQIPNILDNVTESEKEYLEEAIGCAERGYYRAAVVLGWCAAINRMHKKIEELGFDVFNKKSEEMHAITTGRYKRFNKKFNIQNFNELQVTVFDRDLLWVLEYWGLIDSNQNERLYICFVMRNNSAHPGEANISPENLASFYSDLKQNVFENPKFSLSTL